MKIGEKYKKVIHLLFWLVITVIFLYDRRYLIEKAGLNHFVLCVIARLGLIISLAYLNLYYLIPRFFARRKYVLYCLLLLIAISVYVTIQNLYDIYLYGYVIGDIESKHFFYAVPYNFITTCWYLLLTVALKLSFDPYKKKITQNEHIPDTGNDHEDFPQKHIFLKSGTKQIKIDLDDIMYVEGLKDYSVVVTCKEKIIVKGSLKTVARQFSNLKKLIRVHKSYLVAEDKINILKGGRILFGDFSVPVGRMYKKSLEAVIPR